MNPVIIKKHNVRVEAAAPCGGSKSAELLEQGGVVHAIQVRCSCGELTVIELDYAADGCRDEEERCGPSD